MLITGPKKLFTWKNENYRTSLHDLNVMKKESVNQAMGKEKALSSSSTLILYNKLSIFPDPMSHDHKSREKGTVSDSSQMSLCIFLVLYVILKGHLTHSSCSHKSSYNFSDNYCDSTSVLAYLKITWDTCLVVYSWVQPLEILIQQIRGRIQVVLWAILHLANKGKKNFSGKHVSSSSQKSKKKEFFFFCLKKLIFNL